MCPGIAGDTGSNDDQILIDIAIDGLVCDIYFYTRI